MILLGGVEIGVAQGPSIGIAPGFNDLWVLATPPLKAPFLLVQVSVCSWVFWHDRRLEVVGQCNNEMHRVSARRAAHEPLPAIDWEPTKASERFVNLCADHLLKSVLGHTLGNIEPVSTAFSANRMLARDRRADCEPWPKMSNRSIHDGHAAQLDHRLRSPRA